ncbi:MAG: hypothetical protein CMH54_04870 [Myxococcales bacterium]|nr:hypothetical protein [Myxococcales bacterium]
MPKKARFGIAIDGYGITLSCDPGILATISFLPDVRIQQLRYMFANGAFHVEAEGKRTNLFGLVGSITASKIEYRLHELFSSLLPVDMRSPGYSPTLDPNLLENLSRLVNVLGESASGPLDEGRIAHMNPHQVKDLHLYLHAVLPMDVQAELHGAELELFCAKGTSLFISVQTEGELDEGTIRSMKIGSSPPGIILRSPQDAPSPGMNLDIHELVVQPGGIFSFNYDLGMEDIMSLGGPLRRYLGLENVNFDLVKPKVMVTKVRTALDHALERDAPLQLKQWLLKIDPLLPGVDLTSLFGLKKRVRKPTKTTNRKNRPDRSGKGE